MLPWVGCKSEWRADPCPLAQSEPAHPSFQTLPGRRVRGFTLVELLVVVSIITLLIGILAPSLGQARRQARATTCGATLHGLGQGIGIYANENGDLLPPGRLPKVDDSNWRTEIAGGVKYRPTFLALLGRPLGVPPFSDPQPSRLTVDREGEPGDQQNYASRAFVCPEVPHWTDERNGSYGYNYQFLGNSRLRDPADPLSFKNWPVPLGQVRCPSACVAVGDGMGTAASFARAERGDYSNNARDAERYGNEGFNLDPPKVDPVAGEMAGFDDSPQVRAAVHDRHLGTAMILWVDSHVSAGTLRSLGYVVDAAGVVQMTGNNRLWSIDQQDRAWVEEP